MSAPLRRFASSLAGVAARYGRIPDSTAIWTLAAPALV